MSDRVGFFRRKWVRRLARGLVLLLVLLVLGALVTRYVIRWRGERALAEQIAAVDEKDPRWRWDDILADRPPVPVGENSAHVMAQVVTALGDQPKSERPRPLFDDRTLNRRLAEPDEAAVREMLAGKEEALRLARTLVDFPRGRYPTVIQPDSPTAEVSHLEPVRAVANLLELEAERLTLAGRPTHSSASGPWCMRPMPWMSNPAWWPRSCVRA